MVGKIASLTAHTYWISSLCFSPCGQFLTSGGEEGTVYVWDISTWQQVRSYTDFGDVYRIIPSYSPDGILRAAIVNYDDTGPATISVRNLESGEQLYTDKVWGILCNFPIQMIGETRSHFQTVRSLFMIQTRIYQCMDS